MNCSLVSKIDRVTSKYRLLLNNINNYGYFVEQYQKMHKEIADISKFFFDVFEHENIRIMIYRVSHYYLQRENG